MKMKNRPNGSLMKKRKRKSFNWSSIPECRMFNWAHPEMSTPSTAASIPSGTSPSLAATSLVEMSTSPTTLTLFLQLPYSSSAPISTSSLASSAAGMLSRHSHLSSTHPPALAPSFAPSSVPSSQDVVDSRILILPTTACYSERLAKTGLITIQGLDVRGVSGQVSARLGGYHTAYKKRREMTQQNRL
ncbi:hypothetical protein M9H77_17869 [Catharanthus roseus]|uniref:Uncharacterized protein n=1 Tax=Catharanthus roseus TaxID=4058 RepID=A0ACC0B5U6_CATRO|nr:hypothetical protein M9H77_17869 [Catharanthus roseus]